MKRLLFSILLTFPIMAQAGIIAPDGNEWELRGSDTKFADHILEAPTDIGWTWASELDFMSSGLSGVVLAGSDLDAFEGACDGTGGFCSGFFTFDEPDAFFVRGVGSVELAEILDLNMDSFRSFRLVSLGANYRIAFRSVTAVPEPHTIGLLMLGLSGLGLARRRKRLR